jgi:hypothetical protein
MNLEAQKAQSTLRQVSVPFVHCDFLLIAHLHLPLRVRKIRALLQSFTTLTSPTLPSSGHG